MLIFSLPVILIEEVLKYFSKSIKPAAAVGDLSPVSRLAGSTGSQELDDSFVKIGNPQQSTFQAPKFKEDQRGGFHIQPVKVKDD